MSRPSSRLLATTTCRIPSSFQHTFRATCSRPFSQTCTRNNSLLSLLDQEPQQQQREPRTTGPPRTPSLSPLSDASGSSNPQHDFLSGVMRQANYPAFGDGGMGNLANPSYSLEFLAGAGGEGEASKQFEDLGPATEPFHFHVYAHKHNCHITVTKPNRGSIVSLSAGNIGFRKSKRGTYDAAYQLTAYVMDKLNQGGWHKVIRSMEVVLRGFGNGREAATKVLLGAEGKMIRGAITKVSDATRLKFGGTRSPKPRRLG